MGCGVSSDLRESIDLVFLRCVYGSVFVCFLRKGNLGLVLWFVEFLVIWLSL